MIKSFIQLTTLIALTGVLSACSLSNIGKEQDNNQESTELEDRNKLLSAYSNLEGRYTGVVESLSSNKEQFPIEISLFTAETKGGVNNDGQSVPRPVLKAYYRRIGTVDPNDQGLNLEARYYKETQEVLLFSENGSFTIRAVIVQNSLSGVVRNNQGIIGNMSVQLADKTPITSFDGIQGDENRRLRNAYKTITGTYSGKVLTGPNPNDGFLVSIRISVVEVNMSNGMNKPELRAYYKKEDGQAGNPANESVLAVNYFSERIPAEISGASIGGNQYLPVSFYGYFEGTSLVLEVKDQRGDLGTLRAVKVK